MRNFCSAAPGVIWAAVIVFLMLFAEWLSQYFGDVAWVAPVAGFLLAVLVPVLKLLAQGEQPAGRGLTQYDMAQRSAVSRWLW